MNRRMLLGVAAMGAAAPKAAMAMAKQAFARGGPSPIPYGMMDRAGSSIGGLVGYANENPLMALLNAGEKVLMGEHQARLDELRATVQRRQFERQFLASMSDAAKAYYSNRDYRELQEAEGTLFKFTESMRQRYYPDQYAEKSCYPEATQGVTLSRRGGLG